MKVYVKPTIEFVELTVDEKLASCSRSNKKKCPKPSSNHHNKK